jgi:hypothetical protein
VRLASSAYTCRLVPSGSLAGVAARQHGLGREASPCDIPWSLGARGGGGGLTQKAFARSMQQRSGVIVGAVC